MTESTQMPIPSEVASSGATPAPAGVVPADMMRLDLHCHSEASYDCRTPLTAFPQRCAQQGITVQAITDHNQIWGAQKLQELCADNPNLNIIVGEEVLTREGEIIGLFLTEVIPAGLSAQETVERIKAQGGLVLLPHGFDPLKRFRLQAQVRERLVGQIDIVETFNAHISRPLRNRQALEWAEAHSKLRSAGSDAHTLARVGTAWVQTPQRAIDGPRALVEALEAGTVMGQWTHPVIAFAQRAWDFVARSIRQSA
jgi:predicted metal-dependent phosphoesterase TrpH